MKRKIILILFLAFVTSMSACRPDVGETEPTETNLSGNLEENAYPIEEKQPAVESAYPITEADRESLMKSWSLVTLFENGTRQAAQPQTLQLNPDGSYSLTAEKESESGTWTAKLTENEPSLSFYPESGDPSTSIIIELNQNLLHLQSWQGNTQMDTMYLPAE